MFAPANIALIKYWGKRNDVLNLPVTSSLSVSLGNLGTETSLEPIDGPDEITLNGRVVDSSDAFAMRITSFLDLFRAENGPGFRVRTRNTIPTAAGLASSASGFAALTVALARAAGWDLEAKDLSLLARLGSGSACRSLFDGFVEWDVGKREDGLDSHAHLLAVRWPALRLATITVSDRPKPVGSRPAMARTRETALLYGSWPAQVAADLDASHAALAHHDFDLLGRTAEGNALAMHATMIATRPPVLYWLPESVATMEQVWKLREQGLPVYFTMDAGPNLKLLFLEGEEAAVQQAFPAAHVVTPFAAE